MMQFLKSILSRSKPDKEALQRLEEFRLELDIANSEIKELHASVQALAQSYITLSNEIVIVSDIIRQAANMAKQNDYDVSSFMNDDTDDGGYLN
jgi:hypothetical protein